MARQAGTGLGSGAPEILVIGENKGSLGPLGAVLKALGLGFALGLVTTAFIVFVAG